MLPVALKDCGIRDVQFDCAAIGKASVAAAMMKWVSEGMSTL